MYIFTANTTFFLNNCNHPRYYLLGQSRKHPWTYPARQIFHRPRVTQTIIASPPPPSPTAVRYTPYVSSRVGSILPFARRVSSIYCHIYSRSAFHEEGDINNIITTTKHNKNNDNKRLAVQNKGALFPYRTVASRCAITMVVRFRMSTS